MAKKIKSIMLDGEQYQISGEDAGAIRKDTNGTTTTVDKIRAGSQSEYDAITTKDVTTLYIVKE